MPWLAGKRSKLIQALDYYWNVYWSKNKRFILIACGSAASWMLDHLIHAKGGLHNRITKRILLEPFDLKQTKEFLDSRSIRMRQKQILDLYMAIGGVPFYLKEVKKGRSASQIIDEICFKKSGLLYTEFQALFYALFEQAEVNLRVVREIVKAGNSISREQLIKAMGVTSGGRLNRRLYELEASGFIRCFVPYGKKRRDQFYRIIDEYTLVYFKWIEPLTRSGISSGQDSYWQKINLTPQKSTWAGYAFENICLKHVTQISEALGLKKVAFKVGSWRMVPAKKSPQEGAQIDLLFDRDDGIITLCEIKYSDNVFVIDRAYGKNLNRKMEVFERHFSTEKELFLAMITTKGVKKNLWSEELVQLEVKLDDFFS